MKALQIDKTGIREININNTLEALQDAIGGYIEAVTLIPGSVVMIVNEEGLLLDLSVNILASHLASRHIVGPAIVVGVSGEEFTDIPEEVARHIKIRYSS